MKRRWPWVTAIFCLAWVLWAGREPAATDARPYNAGTARRSSSAIALTADGATLLVVNPDSNSLTLVDTASESVIAELPVGVDPRTVAVDDAGQRAYVANRGADSVSVIDLAARQVITTVTVGDRPYGVVAAPTGDRLYVAEQGADRVRILDTATFTTVALLPTSDRPSGLAIGDTGRTLYVTHLLTNTITVLTVRPYVVYLPLVLKTSSSRSITLHSPTSNFQTSNLQLPASHIHLWPDSNLVQSIVLSPDGQRAYIPHTRYLRHQT